MADAAPPATTYATVTWRLPRKAEYVSDGHHYILQEARKVLGNGDRAAEIELCASELLTNALEHGGGTVMKLTAATTATTFRVSVYDAGGTGKKPSPGQDDLNGDRVDNGRGLFIVKALADRWDVRRHGHGTTVWCEFDRPQ